MEEINHWSCTNNFYKKILTGTIFLLAPAANHAWYKPIFFWLYEMAACCYFGVDLGKRFDHYFHLTPHSSSDLLYFTLLLPFTWTNYFKSNSFSPFRIVAQKIFEVQFLFSLLFGQKYFKSNLNSTKIIWNISKLCFSRKIISISQKYSKFHSLPALEKFPLFAYPFHTLAAGV